MSKTFREWKVDEAWLLPPSVRDLVPAGDTAHFIRELVREELNLDAILDEYDEERGFPPYHPVMMTALLLFAYTQGVRSSRKIARACQTRVDFMAVTAMQKPDFRTVSKFRLRHLGALAGLFGQVLHLCQKVGMVKLGHVALDGTKIQANASKHKAMSYGHMKKTEKQLKAEVEQWFAESKAVDEAEDAEYGNDKSGDEMPEWITNKQKRLEIIRAAKAELEADAKAQLKAGVKPVPVELDGPDKPPKGRKGKPPKENGEPNDNAQLNFTDPESKLLKGPNGYLQGYNCQAAVDATAQVIVAHSAAASAADSLELVPMLKQIRANVGRNPDELSADRGYLSESNLQQLNRRRVRGYIAVGRKPAHAGSGKRGPPTGKLTRAMAQKLRRGGHRSRYRLRKQVVEPVFGQMKEGMGMRRLLLRGITKARHEWAMACTAHNLLKLARRAA
jgi:transposase/IS5 family transposase